MYVQLNIRNKKLIINYFYNFQKNLIENHLQGVCKNHWMFLPQHMTTTYDEIFLLGDLNIGTKDNRIKHFCNSYRIQSLIKEAT